jgi:hypothetical protein
MKRIDMGENWILIGKLRQRNYSRMKISYREDGMTRQWIVVLALVLIMCLPLFGQDQASDPERTVAKPAPWNYKDLELSAEKLIPMNYLERLAGIKKIIDVNCLAIKLGASFDGKLATRKVFPPERSSQSLSSNNISLSSSFTYGVYPTEAELNTNFSFDYVDNEIAQTTTFQETMSSYVFNVEQYFSPNWEGYGFIERFSNSFMGVDQRWEVGCGLKWEGEQLTGDRRQKWQRMESNGDILAFMENLLQILEGKEVYRVKIADNDYFRMAAALVSEGFYGRPQGDIEQIVKDVRAYLDILKLFNKENEKGKLWQAWAKRHANAQFDLAGSFLVDITHPSLTYTILSQNADREWLTPSVEKKQFDPESKLRASLRAGVVLRPSENVEISSKWYFKLPLTLTRIRFNDDNVYDLRIDSFSRVGYKIPIGKGSSKIEIGLQLDYFYDNITSFLDFDARKKIIEKKEKEGNADLLGIHYYIENYLGPKSFTSLKAMVAWIL